MIRMIGARSHTSSDLFFRSADGKTTLTFSPDGESLQVAINGDWLWLSPGEMVRLSRWLDDEIRRRG
jgi:hypothetical protein